MSDREQLRERFFDYCREDLLGHIATLEAERCDTIAEHKDCINRLQDTVAELRAIIVRLEAAEKARGK